MKFQPSLVTWRKTIKHTPENQTKNRPTQIKQKRSLSAQWLSLQTLTTEVVTGVFCLVPPNKYDVDWYTKSNEDQSECGLHRLTPEWSDQQIQGC